MMDTKEALKELEDLTVDYGNRNEEQIARIDEAIDMAIGALKAQTDGDTISRQDVIDTVHKIIYGFFSEKDGVMTDTEKTLLSVSKAVCNGVRELPSAEPERTQERTGTHARDLISRKKVRYKLTALVNELEEIFANIRERNEDDSVCGLCEYDGAYIGQSGDWCNECPGFDKSDCFKLKDKYRHEWEAIDE